MIDRDDLIAEYRAAWSVWLFLLRTRARLRLEGKYTGTVLSRIVDARDRVALMSERITLTNPGARR